MKGMSDKTRHKVLSEILDNVRQGIPLESACWSADIEPDWFEDWMKADPRVRKAVLREYAILERTLVREVREGGRGLSAAKAALEILERQFRSWARKTNVTLSSQLDDALNELEKKLDNDTYELVVATLARYS